MEEKNYYISSETIDSVAEDIVEASNTKNKKHLSRAELTVGAVFVIAALICATVWLVLDTVKVGAIAALNQYQLQKETVANNIKQEFYNIGEHQHHVSNRISISLGDIRKQMKLEVLRVSEVEYITSKDEADNLIHTLNSKISDLFAPNIVSWLEVPGYGVFTVDLQSAEFIIDEVRQYVLVRVPFPELSEFTIDYKNVELLNFEESGLFKGTASVGEDLAREQLQSAELTMRQKVKANQEFYKGACNSAEVLLRALILELNPKIPELTVEVEFF